MAPQNLAVLMGRLTRDPEIKTLKGGKEVCNFQIAVQRPFSKNETDFFPCTAWENQAKMINQYFKKGDMIPVAGYLMNNKYTAKDGTERTVTELRVDSIAFIGKGSSGNSSKNDDDELPLE